MAATSHGSVHGSIMCVLCAVKLEDKASRINVRDRNSFSMEDELKNLPITVISKKKC